MPIVANDLATEVDDAIAMNPSTKTQSLSESVLDDILTWQFSWPGRARAWRASAMAGGERID
ncbi:MAG: hypothetical protein HC800_24365 [Phormidesmis sp. RL_2_1]|nr:hypothetical protein [Phormidesmis sp. RL_2_1]